jgi:4-diphosphocytidyl-2-C-methyl-D-erythritol kinase
MGGGLGGGSSDAAATLLATNILFELGHTIEALADMGLALGADVPVFVLGRSAWAEGVGERLTSIELEERWYVVLHPNCHVSTGQIFTDPQLTRDTAAITMSAFFAGQSHNDLEMVVCRLWPEVQNALDWLRQFGAAAMTGSGACVFVDTDSEATAKDIVAQIPAPWQGYAARGINQRPDPVVF